jgi:rhamnosyltransferase
MFGVVIVYHPHAQLLIENISSYLPLLDTLLVYDNSESPNSDLDKQLNSLDPRIKYQYFGENGGIAQRLNQAIAFAKEQGAAYLLTMDQDSSFQPGDFEKYKARILQNTEEAIAQFGVNCQPEFTPPQSNPVKVISLITSGSVLQLKYLSEIGAFNESLFIDFVDTAYSYQITNSGFANLQYTDILLNHTIGTRVAGRSLLTFKKSMRIIHSPTRVYYILRNGLYLLYRQKGLTAIQRQDIKRSMMIVKNNFLYNPATGQVYYYAFLAIKDFLMRKMGKRSL